MSTIVANSPAPVYTAARGDQAVVSDQINQGDQSSFISCQSEYINEDPAFIREAFSAMQPTGCWDTDSQNLPQVFAQDGAAQELSTQLYDGAANASTHGNIAAATMLKNAGDMTVAQDELLHDTEYGIEAEQIVNRRPYLVSNN